jgi:hypothetical protein
MTASGVAVHICDPGDVDVAPLVDRRALCGIGPVYFAPHRGDPFAVNGLCARCARIAAAWVPSAADQLPTPAGPDPLLPLLRAAGLRDVDAVAAAAIARGYLASETQNALARAGIAASATQRRTQEAADKLAGAPAVHPAPMTWRGISAGLSWARDLVHARRTWPPQSEPPAPPDGMESDGDA